MENAITIFLGLLAGMIALYQVKLNIISNSRIKWIETLRETLSEYIMEISHCNHLKINLYDEKSRVKNENKEDAFLDKYYVPYKNSAMKAEKLNAKLLLYLNSDKKNHKKIENLLMSNARLIADFETDNRDAMDKNIMDIILFSKEIFKLEWKKSKRVFKR